MRSRRFLVLAVAVLAALGGLGASAVAQADPPYPPVTHPAENPYSEAKRILGKILFWDEQMSSTNTQACGTCHIFSAGGSDPRAAGPNSDHPGADGIFGTLDDVQGSRGVINAMHGGAMEDDGLFFPDVQRTGRKTPPATDAWFAQDIFWDGRATSEFTDPVTGQVLIAFGGALESQAVGPPVSSVEMAHQNRPWTEILFKLERVRPLALATNLPPDVQAVLTPGVTYPALFAAAFGTPTITAGRVAMAIGTYERTLISDQTPWDAFNAGNTAALTPAQQNGLNIFKTTGNCAFCHNMNGMFTDGLFHNIGLTDPNGDIGRMAVTGDPQDKGRMKTPTLRNVGLREAGGLFHTGTGSGSTLDQVVQFYNNGGVFMENIDPAMAPLGLLTAERLDLVDFLRFGLTDPRVAQELPPFDRPTLHSELQGDGTLPTSNPRTFPGTGFPDSTGRLPQILAQEPPNLNHPFFTVGLANGIGGVPAFLLAGPQNPGSDPPIFGAIPLFVAQTPPPLITPLILNGPVLVHGAGYGSLTVAIADNPALAGLNVYLQWVMLDDGGLGAATSDGVQITIMP